MYKDTITVFNEYNGYWYATVLHNVDLNADRSAILAKYGDSSKDRARLHVNNFEGYVDAREFTGTGFTFASGENFSFFLEGAWLGTSPIEDESYTDGFYNYMNETQNVYAVSSVAKYSVIPHLEVMAR